MTIVISKRKPLVLLGGTARSFVLSDEQGYTTLGMVVALLVTLSLVFTSAQVYRVNTASAAVQEVADVAAIAAENQVGQFMTVVHVCDALVLSLSLTSIVSTGLGVAALCTPVTANVAELLLNAGKKISEARKSFSTTAVRSLNAIQKALPFLAAAKAWMVAKKNNRSLGGSNYLALAVLVPGQAEEITLPLSENIDDAQRKVEEDSTILQEEGSKAEEAAKVAQQSKEIAWRADCGNNPAACMYERANSLAKLSPDKNPLYSSVNYWSFSVALNRARAYYQARYEAETPTSNSVDEIANSALRKNVYAYAVQLGQESYVHETSTSFDAYLPLLPHNTDEMRQTPLYYQAIYPVTNYGGKLCMHASLDCPCAHGYTSCGSVQQMEEGNYETCEVCHFNATSLGSVAAASTNTTTGFEHYYRIVSEQAQAYKQARDDLDPSVNDVHNKVEGLFAILKQALSCAAEERIKAKPPGSLGCICLLVDQSQTSASFGFQNAFVKSNSTLGARAAVSGATLVADNSDKQGNVISHLLDNFAFQDGIFTGALSMLLACWGSFLHAYASGQEAVSQGLKNALDCIPFASASGLGVWASRTFCSTMENVGLQPAKLDALKAVTINTQLIANSDNGSFSVHYCRLKEATKQVAGGAELFSGLIDRIEDLVLSKISGEIEVAILQPLGDWGPSVPITIALPQCAQDAVGGVISHIADQLHNVIGGIIGGRPWQ